MKISILKNEVITGIDLSRKWAEVIEISDSDWQKLIAKTHKFDIKKKELVELPTPEPTEEELKEQKKLEARRLIEKKYKEHDQINTILFGTQEEIDEMKTYIKSILDEYRAKGKDADFSFVKEK